MMKNVCTGRKIPLQFSDAFDWLVEPLPYITYDESVYNY